jgi:hypothetical protein
MAGQYGPSASSKFTAPTYVGWGNANGSNATSAVLPAASPTTTIATGQYSDVGPFREFTTEARAALSSTAVTNNVVTASSVTTTFVGTLTCGATPHNTQSSNGEGGSVGEAFLAFTATKPYETTVFAAVTNGGSMTVSSTGAPATPFYAQLNNEVILVGTVTSNTVYTISRSQNASGVTNNGAVSDGVCVGNIPGAAATNPNNGDMFAHAGFTSLALNTGDSIQFTWNISVTS